MRVDTGKRAKRNGVMKASEARKFDVDGVAHVKPLIVERKMFGYSYEWSFMGRKWSRQTVWFKTKRARDQSFIQFDRRMQETERYRNLKAIDRED